MNYKLYVMRREHQMYQRDVAKKIGIHPQSYHLKESGKREFTLREAKMLATLFGCTLDDLFWDRKEVLNVS